MSPPPPPEPPVEILTGPDPGPAGARWRRFLDLGGTPPADDGARRLLAAIFASGGFLPELLFADLGAVWPALAADPWLGSPKPAALIAGEVEVAVRGAGDFADFKRRLRVYRRREMLRLGAREIGWGTTEEVAAELSAFADACLEQAYRYCDAALRLEMGPPVSDQGGSDDGGGGGGGVAPSFVVMAMGKLGGDELNFSSDVDLIYFYSTDAGQAARPGAEPRSLHQYYVELSRRITEAIEDSTAEGFVFRVDLRLRPEGRSGPLCNSLAAAERYYETFGRTWERQALLRARPCAGDRELGAHILAMLDPFIYPRHIDPRMVDQIRELRGMFRPRQDEAGDVFNVKLGGGGIRDVELVVQTLQLLHGGKRQDLRDRFTPGGLRRLRVAGLLTDREARTLAAAYRFWRQVEHRVQVEEGAQTHLVSGDAAARAVLARRLGFADVAAFDAEVAARRAEVRAIADTFDDPEPDLPAKVKRLLDPGLDRTDLEAILRELGFADVDAAGDAIELARGRLPAELVAQAAASPDPDRALGNFRDLALKSSGSLLALLRDQPQLQSMLATLFGISERLSRTLVAHPSMWEPFLGGLGEPVRGGALLGDALDGRLAALARGRGRGQASDADAEDDVEDDVEAEAREMRRFVNEETLRIGLHDVAGSLTAAEVSRQLTDLAEVCLVRALAAAVPRLVAKRGAAPRSPLTVLAMGSLGAYEMRYGSDLDLVFLHGDSGTGGGDGGDGVAEDRSFYAELARRLIGSFGTLLEEGRLYSVDTRLRPSGEQGLLVTSHRAFERYHREDAAAWERVALLRARVVFTTAPPEQRAAFERMLAAVTYQRPLDGDVLRADLARMRARVERERGKVPPGSRHLRFDPGGIMDVEFLTALGQLSGGAADAALRTTETAAVVDHLIRADGWPATLAADYALLRKLALRMRLLRDRPEDVVGPADLAPLARTLERDPAGLGAAVDQAMQRIRAVYLSRLTP